MCAYLLSERSSLDRSLPWQILHSSSESRRIHIGEGIHVTIDYSISALRNERSILQCYLVRANK